MEDMRFEEIVHLCSRIRDKLYHSREIFCSRPECHRLKDWDSIYCWMGCGDHGKKKKPLSQEDKRRLLARKAISYHGKEGIRLFKILVNMGADVFAPSKRDRTLLSKVMLNNTQSQFKFLIERGVVPTKNDLRKGFYRTRKENFAMMLGNSDMPAEYIWREVLKIRGRGTAEYRKFQDCLDMANQQRRESTLTGLLLRAIPK